MEKVKVKKQSKQKNKQDYIKYKLNEINPLREFLLDSINKNYIETTEENKKYFALLELFGLDILEPILLEGKIQTYCLKNEYKKFLKKQYKLKKPTL